MRPDTITLYKKLVECGFIEDDLRKISPSFVRERGFMYGGHLYNS